MSNKNTRKLKRTFIPNLATVFNMFLGFFAITLILNGEPIKAGWVTMVAIFFDVIDGKLARLMGLSSRFGTEFDSLADTISFCAVPSVLIYSIYVDGLPNLVKVIISFMPLLFGTIRLAKYNILSNDTPKPYFTGLTTPLAATTVISFMLFNFQFYEDMGDGHMIEVGKLAEEIVDKQEGKWVYESPDGGKTVFRRPFSNYDPKYKEEIDFKTKEPTGRMFTDWPFKDVQIDGC